MARSSSSVIAVYCSDLHLQPAPPIARSAEKNWLGVQAEMLKQIESLAIFHGCPIICGGDVFDKACPPIEFVNWTIKHLPKMYAIPGQHDLVNHRYDNKQKGGYWTLVEAGKIIDLEPNVPVEINEIRLHGWPWRYPIKPCTHRHSLLLEVCVAHCLVWYKEPAYPGAPETHSLKTLIKSLGGYDFALFGDNHHRVSYNLDAEREGPAVFNPGSMIRRTSAQKKHKPCVGLLNSNGTIKIMELECEDDVFLHTEDLQKTYINGLNAAEFLIELSELGDVSVNFREALFRFMEREMVPQGVRELVIKHLESKK